MFSFIKSRFNSDFQGEGKLPLNLNYSINFFIFDLIELKIRNLDFFKYFMEDIFHFFFSRATYIEESVCLVFLVLNLVVELKLLDLSVTFL